MVLEHPDDSGPAFHPPEVEQWVKSGLANQDIFGSRQEWKYLLDATQATLLKGEVARQLKLEEVVPGRKRTLVHTLYFDSPDFLLYRQALAKNRSVKFRLRGYATAGMEAVAEKEGYFECKIGLEGRKIKVRTSVALVTAADWLKQGEERPNAMTGQSAVPFLEESVRVIGQYALKPRLTVSYEREAFVAQQPPLRITFDSHCKASLVDSDLATPWPGGSEYPWIIMEVKFLGNLPAWMQDLLAAQGLPPGGRAFSKFKTAVELLFPELSKAEREKILEH